MADQERVVKITVQASSSEQALKQLQNELKKTETRLSAFSQKAANDANTGLKSISKNAGQAGIQIQQFTGQVTNGTPPMVAFSQQAADLGFVLGVPLLGAVLGITASLVGAFIPALFQSNEALISINESSSALADNYSNLSDEQKNLTRNLLATQIQEQEENLKGLNVTLDDTTREFERLKRVEQSYGDGVTNAIFGGDINAAKKEMLEAAGAVAVLEFNIFNLAKKLAALDGDPNKALSDTLSKILKASALDASNAQLHTRVDTGDLTQGESELLKRQRAEQSTLDDLRTADLEKFSENLTHKAAISDAYRQRQQDLDQKFAQENADLQKTQLQKEVDLRKSAMGVVLGFGASLMTEFQTQSRGMFEVSKALSLSMAIASIPGIWTRAMETYGPTPWGYAAAAAGVAGGVLQVSKIAGTQFGAKSANSSGATAPPSATQAATFAPPTRSTQTETTSTNALLNELRTWNASDLIPVEYARRIAESLAEVNRQGGY